MAASMWTFSAGWAKEQHEKVKAAAQAGNDGKALRFLEEFGVYAGIASCVDLAEKQPPAFDRLAAQATGASGNNWAEFCVRLVKDGAVPQGIPAMTAAFYDAARHMILLIRAEKETFAKSRWPDAKNIAKTKLFFPEKVRREPGRRDRICAIAADHVNLGPSDTKQAVLFSLGGFYSLAAARAGAQPTGTTCLLFARSVLHAAGCNVIGGNTISGICSCPLGMFAELPRGSFGYISADQFNVAGGRSPLRGDLFHIKGDTFKDRITGQDTGNDSSHMGIIVDVVGEKSWITIEGGASDHVTRRHQRQLVAVTSPYGKWAFADDTDTTAGQRPLQGWWSIADINANQWIAGA